MRLTPTQRAVIRATYRRGEAAIVAKRHGVSVSTIHRTVYGRKPQAKC